MSPARTIFKDSDDLAVHAADLMTQAAQKAIQTRGRAMLALAGARPWAFRVSPVCRGRVGCMEPREPKIPAGHHPAQGAAGSGRMLVISAG